jgi:hypothetical protein
MQVSSANRSSGFRWGSLLFGLLVAAALLPHLPALSAGFTYDDYPYVVQNGGIRSLGLALASFGQTWPPDDNLHRGLYRPLTQVSYAVDYALAGGAHAWVFHGMSLLLYAITAWLVFRVARRYLETPWAQVATLLFAYHPVHCEVVDSITGRSELLALLAGLTCWLAFLRFERAQRRRWIWLAASVLAYFLAGAAKEAGVMFLGVLVMHVLCFAPPPGTAPRTRWLGTAAVAAGLPLYLTCRWLALAPGHLLPSQVPLAGASLLTRACTVGSVLGHYLRLLVFPTVLQVDPYYAAMVGVVKTPTVVAGVGYAVLVVAVVYLLRGVRRRYRAGDGGPVAAFAIGCFLILYFPASQIISAGALMAERLVFAASVPFAMLAALGAARVFRWTQARFSRSPAYLGALLAIVLVLCSLRSLARAREWHDAQSLWLAMLAHVQHPHAYTNLGIDALSRDDVPAAKAYFNKAIELDHDPYLAWFNLAAYAERQYRLTEALALYHAALAARPGDEATRARLANCEDAIAAASKLVEHYRSQLESTRDVQILRKLGGACVTVGDLPCAQRAVDRIGNLDAR